MAMSDVDKRIKEGAEAISSDLAGPAGQIALDRVVARHLGWFELCQQRGMSWPQIAGALHAAGAGRETGLPFSHRHLSAVVWRQRQKAAIAPPISAPVEEKRRSGGRSRSVQKRAPRPAPPVVGRPAAKVGTDAPHSGAKVNIASGEGFGVIGAEAVVNRTPPHDDIAAYMKRAANIRRSRDDD
jgi:hypothetical protein